MPITIKLKYLFLSLSRQNGFRLRLFLSIDELKKKKRIERNTCDDEPDGVDAGRMDGDLALVNAFVAWPGEFDLQPPIVGMLEVERKSRVGAVRLHADGEQVELLLVTAHPRHLLL
jgi:hypothetical protein